MNGLVLVSLVHYLAANNRQVDCRLFEFLDRNFKDVAVDDNKVGQFACFNRAQFVWPVKTKAPDTALRVTVDGLLES